MTATTHFQLAAEQARAAGDTDSFVRAALGSNLTQFLAGMPPDHSIALLTEAEAAIAPEDNGDGASFLRTSLARTSCEAT